MLPTCISERQKNVIIYTPSMLGNFSCFFVVCWFFFKSSFFEKILSWAPSECQTVWIQIRPDKKVLMNHCISFKLYSDTMAWLDSDPIVWGLARCTEFPNMSFYRICTWAVSCEKGFSVSAYKKYPDKPSRSKASVVFIENLSVYDTLPSSGDTLRSNRWGQSKVLFCASMWKGLFTMSKLKMIQYSIHTD